MIMKKTIILGLCFLMVITAGNGIVAGLQSNMEITDIEFRGNENVSDGELKSIISIEIGEILEERKLQNDFQELYGLGYFQEIDVNFQEYQQGVRVIWELFENPLLKEFKITGEPVLSKDEIKNILKIEYDEIINMKNLENGLQELEREYHERGYIPATQFGRNYHFINYEEIELTPEGEFYLPLSIAYLNDVTLEGNEKTRDFVIKRELDFDREAPLSMEEIQQNLQTLYHLNYFEEINPKSIERIEGTNKVNLIIDFKERQTGTLNFGAGYSSKDSWIGMVNIREENFMGYGQTIGFEWEFGGTNNLSIKFKDPRLMGTPMSFGFDFYKEKQEGKEIIGGNMSVGYPIAQNWRGSVKYRMENFIEDNALLARTRSVTLQARQDTRNHPFNPTAGGLNEFLVEYAPSFLGGNEFSKYSTDLRRFFPGFKEKHAWALRLKGGYGQFEEGSDNNILAHEKFAIGGPQTLRGYDRKTGEKVLLMNLEYRFPIYNSLTGVVFADSGNVWDNESKIKLEDINSSAGVGLRLNTPIGQIRLDYAFNKDNKPTPHFSIGQTF